MSFVKGRLPLRLKIVHGSGAIAFGVKDGGFSFFLLPFYNLVLGVEAWIVSAALATALVVDALVDPLIGHLSDRTYTRWGRRLPWLYIAPIPLALMWTLLWSPPFTGAPSFIEIVMLAVGVRLLLSACEVPSVSLVPEITEDYVERTTLFRFRFLSGWFGGLLMMILTFSVFLPTPEAQLQPEGYAAYGIAGACIMAVSVIGSAAGQHRIVAKRPEKRPPPFSLTGAFAEIFDAFRERAFLIFALGGLAAYVSQGMTFSMTQYLNLYVWQFSETAFQAYPLVLGASVVLMFLLVGPLHKRFGKPASAAGGAIAALAIIAVPYSLFLLGAWPEVGGTPSTVMVMAFFLFANTAGIVSIISATSMVAEIVEAFEERTGKRAEATFYSGNWLVQKCATGGGIMLTGLVISLIGLEPGTPQAEVEAGVTAELALLYLGALALLTVVSAFWLARFPITREQHEARVAARHARAEEDGGEPDTEALAGELRPGLRAGARPPKERPQTG
ncbi:glycoside/pentoside/hexuronide:cation symporter, GPH family [Erythrobacter litoralis]|uniref:Sugar transporter n=1 Tax=Erythrobacter litoralis TaxID=39960 RepID=A0A074M5C4_9SPHN|nr:MFS transporter [Erythrobacter litoralis]AOL22724.1 glycoside/pentoside/hexuronide:cation symporter, GPH family [Erythrobacter litoralis]KEO89911.1 sugar transporter [Erythrobacter litoralis]